MRRVIGKKGSGQFEMVISFVFFIGFVFFLFMVLTPEDTTTLSGAVISGLYDSFGENANTNLSNVFLRADRSGGGGCFSIQLPSNIFVYALSAGDSSVKELDGGKVESDLISEDLDINSDDEFFRVAISPEFANNAIAGCLVLASDEYELGSVLERRVLSYSALEKMTNDYYGDYTTLRTNLRIPPIYDFSIVAEDMPDISMIPKSGIPSSGDVMARDFVFEVLKSDGTVTNERINFRVW